MSGLNLPASTDLRPNGIVRVLGSAVGWGFRIAFARAGRSASPSPVAYPSRTGGRGVIRQNQSVDRPAAQVGNPQLAHLQGNAEEDTPGEGWFTAPGRTSKAGGVLVRLILLEMLYPRFVKRRRRTGEERASTLPTATVRVATSPE